MDKLNYSLRRFINYFKDCNVTMKISLIVLILVVIIGIFQGVSLLLNDIFLEETQDSFQSRNTSQTPYKNDLQSSNGSQIIKTPQQNSNGGQNVSNNGNSIDNGSVGSSNSKNNNTSSSKNYNNSNDTIVSGNNTVSQQNLKSLPTLLGFQSGKASSATKDEATLIMKEIQKEFAGKLNVRIIDGNNQGDIINYDVVSFPTQILLNTKGEEIDRLEGNSSKENIVDWLIEMGVRK